MLIFVFLSLFLAGCTHAESTVTIDKKPKAATQALSKQWRASPTFSVTSNGITVQWIGEKGRVAVTNFPFIAGQTQKYMWLFWGNENEIIGKDYKVIATSDRGIQKTVLSGQSLNGPIWGATASSPSLITLPTKGMWRLDAYVNDQLHGTIFVEVK
ncbi:DUF4871 domain-containing protein [Polycladomyces sp. WAk]|uniref:DUF4871 domain-containing protein n=1 Tax=Polycladomyces zharkentensis TaxID=2807616 RepID=A0ABS2WN64_9BACL|nr:DUF4871 domain-containing protein [Polycladomyces sp. WAk]MBN2910829.1 DUF4871 domain-containing protein [Polycladomyces sp. WAk]